MKLHLAASTGRNQFTGYGDGYIAINNQRYQCSVVVTPEAVHDSWNVASFDDIRAEHLQFVLSLAPEIVILGTGARQRFPRAELMREFATARVGVEIMETRAACRTYNILMTEGRAVVAAVLIT